MRKLFSVVAVVIMTTTQAFAQQSNPPGCLVQEAAQAALEREITLIRALAADPEDAFTGPNSCIDGSVLNSFDLSTSIPDLAGLLTSVATNAFNSAISSARGRACRAINDAVSGAIGDVENALSGFESSLTAELEGILDNGWEELNL